MKQVMRHSQIKNQLVTSRWKQFLSEHIVLAFKDVLSDKLVN